MRFTGLTRKHAAVQCKKSVTVLLAAALLAATPARALQLRAALVKIPEHASLSAAAAAVIPENRSSSTYRVYYFRNGGAPATLTVTDPFGAAKTFPLPERPQPSALEIASGIVKNPLANPEELDVLPKLCPRLKKSAAGFVYEAATDMLNRRPGAYLFDPDIDGDPAQRNLLDEFDGNRALAVTRVKLSYDREDSAILDYEGPDPLTGAPGHKVYEGEGGFYANLHYAVIPYDERYANLGRQEMLHLVQGRLGEIDRGDLKPALRTHSFLPGPYLSKDGVYAMCEWGDTAHQAKVQELRYDDFLIWDWDAHDNGKTPSDKVLLVVWEGDEEAWMIAEGLLDPFYLTDDLVGVFAVSYADTLEPATFRTEAGDFEIEIVTKPD